jgi:1-aminocyclopropane-1-carboxylate deaminase/D-cysteine desulfhydrase-like pyridoxal-dependent ACC family enzyme
MTSIANRTAELMGLEACIEPEQINVDFDYIGPGYGKVSPAGLEAIALLARTEGIMLDPIYSGKAMSGLIDQVRHGRFNNEQNIVFVHTGGTPALFAYNEPIASGVAARTS